MRMNRFTKITLLLGVIILLGTMQPFKSAPVFGQDQCQAFKETGKNVCGRFLQYWQQNGGLFQQGFPISDEFQEISDVNGQTYTVQYFERAVFEKHPEKQPPYDVLLAQLGRFHFNSKYVKSEPIGEGGDTSPNEVIGWFFRANMYDGGVAIATQRSLLSKRLLARFQTDPSIEILGPNFPAWRNRAYAQGTNFSGAVPVWVLLLDDKGGTAAIFTLIKVNGAWKIDDVEPNILGK